ncbi:971_t:CDS:2, partial [Racocetra fulgida]
MELQNSRIQRDQSHHNNDRSEATRNNLSNESTLESYFEDGRRYTAENQTYFLPNDDKEYNRLNLQHSIMKTIWQGNFSAPVKLLLDQEGTKVLDVGTGSGSWVIDMAADYPKAKFTGVDISPPPSNNIPKNAEFLEGNVFERLPFEDNTFDYVFQRLLYVGVPAVKWPSVVNELVRVLKPGGYLEPKLITILNVSSNEYDDMVQTVGKELAEFEAYYPH